MEDGRKQMSPTEDLFDLSDADIPDASHQWPRKRSSP